MTLFGSILHGLGLSQSEAAAYLNVRIDTVKSWSSGRNSAPQGVFAKLHELAERQETMAQAIMDSWEEADKPSVIEVAWHTDVELARRGWPSRDAFVAMVRRAWELIGPEVKIEFVLPGSTEAVRGAAKMRASVEG